MDQPKLVECQGGLLDAWHLAILRFAVTLQNADRLSVLAIANAMDRLGRPREVRSDFAFFRRTSTELCAIILAPSGTAREALRRYLAQIADARLKRALAAALDIDSAQPASLPRQARPDNRALWHGLPSRDDRRA